MSESAPSPSDFDGWDADDLRDWIVQTIPKGGDRVAVGLALSFYKRALPYGGWAEAVEELAGATGITASTLTQWRAKAEKIHGLSPRAKPNEAPISLVGSIATPEELQHATDQAVEAGKNLQKVQESGKARKAVALQIPAKGQKKPPKAAEPSSVDPVEALKKSPVVSSVPSKVPSESSGVPSGASKAPLEGDSIGRGKSPVALKAAPENPSVRTKVPLEPSKVPLVPSKVPLEAVTTPKRDDPTESCTTCGGTGRVPRRVKPTKVECRHIKFKGGNECTKCGAKL